MRKDKCKETGRECKKRVKNGMISMLLKGYESEDMTQVYEQ